MANRQFTDEEVQNMRMAIAQHERQGIGEFDINNPPKKPYHFQEFPKTMYFHETGANCIVSAESEQIKMEKAGWSTKPTAPKTEAKIAEEPAPEEPAPEDPFVAAEQEEIEPPEPRRGPGRPRKEI